MKNKLFLLAAFASLTISISANTNTNELEKFNSAKSTISFTENKGQISDQNYVRLQTNLDFSSLNLSYSFNFCSS